MHKNNKATLAAMRAHDVAIRSGPQLLADNATPITMDWLQANNPTVLFAVQTKNGPYTVYRHPDFSADYPVVAVCNGAVIPHILRDLGNLP